MYYFTIFYVINYNMRNNKAAGLDEITAELLKHGKDIVVEELTQLFNLIWNSEEVPTDWGRVSS